MKKLLLIFCLSIFLFAENGWNELHHAVYADDLKLVEKLLKKHDIQSATKAGLTSLHIAVKRRNQKMIKFLIDKDADVDAQDNKGFSPLYYAVIQNRVSIARILLNNDADPNLINNIGNAPIHQIAYKNRFEMLDLFLNYDIDLNLKNRYGMLPYHFAQKGGNSTMVQELQSLMRIYKK